MTTTSTSQYPTVTLPIELHDGGLGMNAQEARSLGELLHTDYEKAQPFPHIVVEGLLPQEVLDLAVSSFPDRPLPSDGVFNIGYAGQNKRQILPEDLSPRGRELFRFFNSAPMLQFLEGLTGIQGLLPDPYFVGGGYHETTRGGKLGIHADFRINEKLNVRRRLNIIIYLNPVWDDAWFGHLELWDKGMTRCEARVAPILNRCVVFNTEADTWHGHPDELATPEGVNRRSIALYYYTASESVRKEVPGHDTIYQARPGDSAEIHAFATRDRWRQSYRLHAPTFLVQTTDKIARGIKRVFA